MVNKRISENGKVYVKLADLQPWQSNPRTHSDEDLLRLKKQIARLGQYKPVFINSEGDVLGGNKRLLAYQELNTSTFEGRNFAGSFDEIWVSILTVGEKEVEGTKKYYAILNDEPQDAVFDSIDQIFIEYAISDNDEIGSWDRKALATLIQPFQKLIPMADYKLEIAPAVSLKTFTTKQAQEATKDDEKKSKKVVLKVEFTPDQFAQFEARLQKVSEAYKSENITDLFTTLVEEAEVFINDKEKQAQEQAA